MNDFTPSPEFEEKVQAAAAAPSANPEFVNRLRTQMVAAVTGATGSQPQRQAYSITNLFRTQGNKIMRPRLMVPALVAVVLIAVVAFFALNPITTVSAQQILDRASAAQSTPKPAQGIWHIRFEDYEKSKSFGGDHAGTTIVEDHYQDLATGYYRIVTHDTAGKLIDVNAYDGSFYYWTPKTDDGKNISPLTVNRFPQTQGAVKKPLPYDTATTYKALFDQFNNNPRVELEGRVTQADGSQAYVLVNRSYQTQKSSGDKILTGITKMVFNTQTYQLIASSTAIHQDGKDILVSSINYTQNEILPAGSTVVWNLSDLKEVTFVDQPAPEQSSTPVQVGTMSEHELAQHTKAYVLKTIPAGFTQKIIIHPIENAGDPFTYEINYDGPENKSFGMQAVGVLEDSFIATAFYDGSYKTASGLVLHFSPSSSDAHTSAMLTIPDGTNFLLYGTFSREQVEAMAEDLIPIK